MRDTIVDGVRIEFDDQGEQSGDKPAFLLLPGWCTNRSVFRELAKRLAEHQRTITIDWAGHGGSAKPAGDFGARELVAQAKAVIVTTGIKSVIPVTISHAGWVALDLRRELGSQVSKIALLDWIVSEAPPPFLDALRGMQSPDWRAAVDAIFGMWLHGVENEAVIRFVREEMAAYEGEMWARAAREISAAYAQEKSPLAAFAALDSHVETLHLYAQPEDPGYLGFQRDFAAKNPWFHVQKLDARSHFPMLECPDQMAAALLAFS